MTSFPTDKEAYIAMQSCSNIFLLNTFEEVEAVFVNILTLWQHAEVGKTVPQIGETETETNIGADTFSTSSRAGAKVTRDIKGVVGFDLEWRPHVKGGNGEGEDDDTPTHLNPHRVALMQMTLRLHQNGNNDTPHNKTSLSSAVTYLIRMYHLFSHETCCPGVHPQYQNCALFRFLRDPLILKCGVGILGDKKKLAADYGVSMAGTVELGRLMHRITALGPLAGGHDNSHLLGRMAPDVSSSLSLESIVQQVCQVSLIKNKTVQCSNWDARSLSSEQLLYAAADAYYGLLACEGMLQRAQAVCGITGCMQLVSTVRDMEGKRLRRNCSSPPSSGVTLSSSSSSDSHSQQTRKEAKRDGLTVAKSPIYDSCALLTKEGVFLSYCDLKKLKWYLSKELAEELSAEEISRCITAGTLSVSKSGKCRVVRLNFEAKGAGNLNDSYKRQQLQNRCVVCGVEQAPAPSESSVIPPVTVTPTAVTDVSVGRGNGTTRDQDLCSSVSLPPPLPPLPPPPGRGRGHGPCLLHHHVVPKAYRKVFPAQMVSKNNHDIVPVCRPCKARVADLYAVRMRALEEQYLDTADKDMLHSRLKTNKSEALRLSKVQGYCQTLLTSAFYKKLKIEAGDGTKITDKVLVSEADTRKIKESVLITLQQFCCSYNVGILSREESINNEEMDDLFVVHSEVKTLQIDDPAGIRSFMNSFEHSVMQEIEVKKQRIDSKANITCEVKVSSRNSSGGKTVRNKETIIIQKLIEPFRLESDDVDQYLSLLQDFEAMWRSFFLETVRPLHMPPHWRIDYKHGT